MGHLEFASVLESPFRFKFLCRGTPRTDEQSLVSTDHAGRNLHTRSQSRERVLDVAIVQADITESLEEYRRELS